MFTQLKIKKLILIPTVHPLTPVLQWAGAKKYFLRCPFTKQQKTGKKRVVNGKTAKHSLRYWKNFSLSSPWLCVSRGSQNPKRQRRWTKETFSANNSAFFFCCEDFLFFFFAFFFLLLFARCWAVRVLKRDGQNERKNASLPACLVPALPLPRLGSFPLSSLLYLTCLIFSSNLNFIVCYWTLPKPCICRTCVMFPMIASLEEYFSWQCVCIFIFECFFFSFFYNFIKEFALMVWGRASVVAWGRSWVEFEREKMRKCLYVCFIQPFSLTHSTGPGRRYPKRMLRFCFWFLCDCRKGSFTFFPPTLFFLSFALLLAVKKTRGEGSLFSRLYRRRKRGRTRKIFISYFILPQRSKKQKGWNLWVVKSSKSFARVKIRIFLLDISWKKKVIFERARKNEFYSKNCFYREGVNFERK